MNTQVCTKCNLEFPKESFGTYKNRSNILFYRECKDCRAKRKSEHYRKNEEAYKLRAKNHFNDNREHHRKLSKEYNEKHRERLSRIAKERYTSEEGREANRLRSRKYRENPINKLKEKARGIVNKRIQSGKMVKPETCVECGAFGKVEAHHEDYNKPLEVLWVCKRCHFKKHTINEGHDSKE